MRYNKNELRTELVEFLQTDPSGFRSFISGVFAEAGEVANGWICGPPSRVEIPKVPLRYEVGLRKAPGSKLGALKVLREVTGFGAHDAHDLLHGRYGGDFLGVDARRIAEVLTRVGFKVFLRRVGSDPASYELYQAGNMSVPKPTLDRYTTMLEES